MNGNCNTNKPIMEENRKHRKAVYCDTYNVHEKKMHTHTHTHRYRKRRESNWKTTSSDCTFCIINYDNDVVVVSKKVTFVTFQIIILLSLLRGDEEKFSIRIAKVLAAFL